MNYNDYFRKVVQDISFLYELTLSVGESFEVEENCAIFLKRLMERMGLSYGAIWIYDYILTGNEQKKGATLVYDHPDYYTRLKKIPRTHPLLNCLNGDSFYMVDSSTPEFMELINEENIEHGSYIVFALGNIGILKLFSFLEKEPFCNQAELKKLEKVIARFTVSLEGCFSCRQLARETKERKMLEASLKEREERYRFLTENANDIVWTMDLNLNVTYVSPAITRVLGFTQEEAMCQALVEKITPESMTRVMDVYAREVELEKVGGFDPDRSVTLEAEYYHKNKSSTVWMENNIKALRNSKGEMSGFYGVTRDITDRKKYEAELEYMFYAKLLPDI